MMIAVSGLARSGTTILRDVLSTHPCVKILYEASLFDRLPAATSAEYLASLTPKRKNEVELKRLMTRLREVQGPVTYAVLEPLLKEVLGVPHVGDKSSSYFRLFDQHGAAGLRRIYIYRDARDACASYWKCIHNQWRGLPWAQVPLNEVASRWVASINAAAVSRGVHCVRYEEFIANPGPVMASVAEFLGVDNQFDASNVHGRASGRSTLTPDELRCIEHTAGPTLRSLGYT